MSLRCTFSPKCRGEAKWRATAFVFFPHAVENYPSPLGIPLPEIACDGCRNREKDLARVSERDQELIDMTLQRVGFPYVEKGYTRLEFTHLILGLTGEPVL